MSTEISKASPFRFFSLALGISWFFWIWIVLFGWNVWEFPAVLLGAFGLFGPAFAEIVLIYCSHDKAQWRDYWQRVLDVRRIEKGWFLVIIFTYIILNAVVILICISTGLPLSEFETAKNLLSEPWRVIPFAIFILIFGPLPEELGWRGYALDGLQVKYNALISSLLLGIVWALWHVPLFFMKGTFQHDQLGFATPSFWMFLLGPVVISVLFTWIYNNTNRSTLSAILFHFMANFTGELIPLPEQGRVYSTILVTVLVAMVVVIWGPKTLTRQPKRKKQKTDIQN